MGEVSKSLFEIHFNYRVNFLYQLEGLITDCDQFTFVFLE